jgi:hypothetical protein
MIDKLREFVNWMHQKGIPLPAVRDYSTAQPSVSLTMLIVSFTMVIVGLIGKSAGFLGGVDLSQALTLFGLCAGLYFSRRVSSKGDDKSVTIESKDGDNK